MSNFNDGGPAFPQARVTVLAEDGTPNESAAITHDGMSLRDHYAGLAMQSFCQGAKGMGGLARDEIVSQFDRLAEFAYLLADSMVRAKAKT